MFYVSISQVALDKVVEHAKNRGHEEVVGILIGRVVGQTVVVEDAITGRIESTATRAVLPPDTIAKIADDIIKQRVQGNIVGWYHSHPGYGIFMSNVDVTTQTRLQQFSPYVTALIVDHTTDQVGFFTLNTSGAPQSIPPESVHIFGEGDEPVPAEFEAPIQPPPTPFEELPAPVPVPRRGNRWLVVVFLVVVIGLGFLGAAIFLLPPRYAVLERIPVTTHYARNATVTQTLTTVVELWLVTGKTYTTAITAAETTRTFVILMNETITSWSSRIVVTTRTTTFTETVTSTYTTTSWTTVMTPPKVRVTWTAHPNQLEGLVEVALYSMTVTGMLLVKRRLSGGQRTSEVHPGTC